MRRRRDVEQRGGQLGGSVVGHGSEIGRHALGLQMRRDGPPRPASALQGADPAGGEGRVVHRAGHGQPCDHVPRCRHGRRDRGGHRLGLGTALLAHSPRPALHPPAQHAQQPGLGRAAYRAR